MEDFVAIEFQALDTTGTVWPERQRLLRELCVRAIPGDARKSFGINWKMTANTILVQRHHKAETLEHLGKHFALILQDHLLNYLREEFRFDHFSPNGRVGDTLHVHSYALEPPGSDFGLQLSERLSTDAAGVATCLGVRAETRVELETIVAELERKISPRTRLTPDPTSAIVPMVDPAQ